MVRENASNINIARCAAVRQLKRMRLLAKLATAQSAARLRRERSKAEETFGSRLGVSRSRNSSDWAARALSVNAYVAAQSAVSASKEKA